MKYRQLRYLSVSLVNVPLVQICILAVQVIFNWDGWLAVVVVMTALTGPAYWATKRWVWADGTADTSTAVGVFWLMSMIGLAGSAALTYAVGRTNSALWVANVASMTVFGLLFVLRYLVLDRLFARREE